MKKQSFEDILNRRIENATKEIKDGNYFSSEKAKKKYQVLMDIKSSIVREK